MRTAYVTAVALSCLSCFTHNVFLKYYHSNMTNAESFDVFEVRTGMCQT